MDLLKLRNKEKFSINRFLESDKSIKFYTGFSSYQALHAFYQFLGGDVHFLKYPGSLRNVSTDPTFQTRQKRKLNPIEELFITLVRLRKGLLLQVMADLYNLSVGYISRIINTWIIFIAKRVQCLPIWPSKETVRKSLPKCFSICPDIRIIIDCTEIFLERPSASQAQSSTFSSYKHSNTAKGLVGIAPSGQITYMSPLYAGRVSDKKLLNTGLLDKLERGDVIMADRGFDVEEELQLLGISLKIPDFLGKRGQFPTGELARSRDLAAVRVHVERAMRKIKEFRILSQKLPISLTPMADKIWICCCHLANLTGVLIHQ